MLPRLDPHLSPVTGSHCCAPEQQVAAPSGPHVELFGQHCSGCGWFTQVEPLAQHVAPHDWGPGQQVVSATHTSSYRQHCAPHCLLGLQHCLPFLLSKQVCQSWQHCWSQTAPGSQQTPESRQTSFDRQAHRSPPGDCKLTTVRGGLAAELEGMLGVLWKATGALGVLGVLGAAGVWLGPGGAVRSLNSAAKPLLLGPGGVLGMVHWPATQACGGVQLQGHVGKVWGGGGGACRVSAADGGVLGLSVRVEAATYHRLGHTSCGAQQPVFEEAGKQHSPVMGSQVVPAGQFAPKEQLEPAMNGSFRCLCPSDAIIHSCIKRNQQAHGTLLAAASTRTCCCRCNQCCCYCKD